MKGALVMGFVAVVGCLEIASATVVSLNKD